MNPTDAGPCSDDLMLPVRDRSDGRPVLVRPGPVLLDGLAAGPGLAAHRRRHGRPVLATADELRRMAECAGLLGRGGAGFPFATKLAAALESPGRPEVVINLSEGEPASFKDAALALTAPHRVLDGAWVAARALGARTVHVVVPEEVPAVGAAVRRAVGERASEVPRVHWRLHEAAPRFVAGQARAVIELLSGRPNLPVTAWQPEAVRGYRNRPTLLSNAETWAQLGELALRGQVTRDGEAVGTTLLTVHSATGRGPVVMEVEHGRPWCEVLGEEVDRPVLVGGFHGTWVTSGGLVGHTVDRGVMAEHGITLGAGVVLPLPAGDCPLRLTARLVAYLASQSAGRCGPCLNGLPALAETVAELDDGHPTEARARQLVGLVTRRGACAHPDGTARLVVSLLDAFPDEAGHHARGDCAFHESRPDGAAIPDGVPEALTQPSAAMLR